jgi:hypothetical protein
MLAATVIILALFLLPSKPISAEQPFELPPEVMEQMRIQEQGGALEDEGLAMMMAMVNIAYFQERASFVAQLNILARPETGKQLASYSKNFFDALRANGFDREDAVRVMTLVGIPTIPGK